METSAHRHFHLGTAKGFEGMERLKKTLSRSERTLKKEESQNTGGCNTMRIYISIREERLGPHLIVQKE